MTHLKDTLNTDFKLRGRRGIDVAELIENLAYFQNKKYLLKTGASEGLIDNILGSDGADKDQLLEYGVLYNKAKESLGKLEAKDSRTAEEDKTLEALRAETARLESKMVGVVGQDAVKDIFANNPETNEALKEVTKNIRSLQAEIYDLLPKALGVEQQLLDTLDIQDQKKLLDLVIKENKIDTQAFFT